MSEMFTIKPLRWTSGIPDNGKAVYEAKVGMGREFYEVWHNDSKGWGWWGVGHIVDHKFVPCESDHAARLAAEAHWQARIKQALVAVEVKQHDGSGQ